MAHGPHTGSAEDAKAFFEVTEYLIVVIRGSCVSQQADRNPLIVSGVFNAIQDVKIWRSML